MLAAYSMSSDSVHGLDLHIHSTNTPTFMGDALYEDLCSAVAQFDGGLQVTNDVSSPWFARPDEQRWPPSVDHLPCQLFLVLLLVWPLLPCACFLGPTQHAHEGVQVNASRLAA